MKLEKVILHNIRQFVGTQEIEFSTSSSKKVTLFRAPNTTGKTTLLNAVFWCLYGDFLAGFDEPERLLSAQADFQEYWVEVSFENKGKSYIARRVGTGLPKDASFQVLELSSKSKTSTPHPQPDLLVNSILPKSLASFFFFAGEYLKQSITGKNSKQTTDSIRSVLGFGLAEQTINDLKEIRKKKQRELQTLSAGTDLAKVSAELEEAESFVDLQSQQLIAQRDLVSQLEDQKKDVYSKIRGFESTTKLQSQRDRIEDQLETAMERLNDASIARQQLIPQLGHSIYLLNAAQTARSFIDDAVTHKRIPSPFDKTFVQDILNSKVCVCGRPVDPGTDQYKAIYSLLNNATDEAVLKRALSVRGVSERVVGDAESAKRQIKTVFQQHMSCQENVERLEQEKARISDILRKHEQQNIRELEVQLDSIEKTLRELVVNRQRTEESISIKRNDIERLKKEFERAQGVSPQVSEAKLRLELLELLISQLEIELNHAEAHGIVSITKALNSVVGSATRQKYAAEVLSDYSLMLFKDEPGQGKIPVLVLSSGERRLLVLCFMSALVKVCRDREADVNSIVLPGAVAPMMVDAPFGELDPEYQALAATTMAELSDQLILLLSKTHYTEEVQKALRPVIGKDYALFGHKRGVSGTATPVRITIDGVVHDQIQYGAEKDWTEIKLVENAS